MSSSSFKPDDVNKVDGAIGWSIVIKTKDNSEQKLVVSHAPSDKTYQHPLANDFLIMLQAESDDAAKKALKLTYMKFLMAVKEHNKGVVASRPAAKTSGNTKIVAQKANSKTQSSIAKKSTSSAPAPAKIKKADIQREPVVSKAKVSKAKAVIAPKSTTTTNKTKIEAEKTKVIAKSESEAEKAPPKGKVGSQERFVYSEWLKKEEKRKLSVQLELAKMSTVASASTKLTKSKEKNPVKEVKADKKRKAASTAKDEDKDSEEKERQIEERDYGDEEPMVFATRAPGKNAKGRDRKLGKGKRASANDEVVDNERPKSRAKKADMNAEAATNQIAPLTGKGSTHPMLAGAETLFRAQRVGSKGLKDASRRHSQRSAIMPSDSEFRAFTQSLDDVDPIAEDKEVLLKCHLKNEFDWLWRIQLNFNLLLYGVGCKEKLLNSFIKECLTGEDVLIIDGSRTDIAGTGTRTVKALLDQISESVLKQQHTKISSQSVATYARSITSALSRHYKRENTTMSTYGETSAGELLEKVGEIGASAANSFFQNEKMNGLSENHADDSNKRELSHWHVAAEFDANADPDFHSENSRVSRSGQSSSLNTLLDGGEADPTWGGRFAHAQAKLYIVVKGIDGDCLQGIESQRVLADLAQCPAVSIIATCDKINAPLLWGNDLLSKFRWSFEHVPTYVSYPIRSDFAMFTGQKGAVAQNQALEYILRSLTNRHKELLSLVASESLKLQDLGDSSSSMKGLLFEELLDLATKAMIVQTSNNLSTYLKELEDHRLVSITTDASKRKFVLVLLSRDTLEKLASR